MYLGIVIATIIVFLIAVYLATKKKEPETTNNFSKIEKVLPVQEIKVKEPEPAIVLEQSQNNRQTQPPQENQSEPDQEPPFQSPSEPEIL
jgi:hypothetical protein